jgi:hypothetical protein
MNMIDEICRSRWAKFEVQMVDISNSYLTHPPFSLAKMSLDELQSLRREINKFSCLVYLLVLKSKCTRAFFDLLC